MTTDPLGDLAASGEAAVHATERLARLVAELEKPDASLDDDGQVPICPRVAAFYAERAATALRTARYSDDQPTARTLLDYARSLLLRAVAICDPVPVGVGGVRLTELQADSDARADQDADAAPIPLDEVDPSGFVRLTREGLEKLRALGVTDAELVASITQDSTTHDLAPSSLAGTESVERPASVDPRADAGRAPGGAA